ncbi:MAG TPA: hypothetical protein PKK10_09525 [Woeseiaceae bacterium]|nr:hypothetical protein [Woeseiaceae bacterium]
MNKMTCQLFFALLAAFALPLTLHAQDNAAAQANNPLANTTAFNVQGYYIYDFTDIDDSGSQLLFRYAKPLSWGSTKWLMRATLPINNFPVGPNLDNRTGPGDFDVFAAYLVDTGDPAISFGFGPDIVIPTASPQGLGNEQYQVGLANVYFNARSTALQFGYLAIYRTGIGDTNGRDRVNLFVLQPFAFLQLGGGWYTGTAPIMSYDFETNNYTIPFGLRIGKVFKSGKTVFNIFAEPQVSVADSGAGLPESQIFFGVNMQY